jgi:hypothetical protein
LALVNLASYVPGSKVPVTSAPGHQESKLVAGSNFGSLFCLTEQKLGSSSSQGSSSSNYKNPVSPASIRSNFAAGPATSDFQYFLLSKYLAIGLETTDIIFPFHVFW